MSIQLITHYFLHFIFPGFIALAFFKDKWKKVWLIMIATMIIDLDHLFAWPELYVPDRCSIGFHPLHSYWAIAIYIVLLFFPKTRIAAIGLLWHMITDGLDCAWMKWIN